jgi:hypothetical protein
MKEAALKRCDSMAKRGTGTGICDHVLDEHGQCSNASNHTDEFQGERQPLTRGKIAVDRYVGGYEDEEGNGV